MMNRFRMLSALALIGAGPLLFWSSSCQSTSEPPREYRELYELGLQELSLKNFAAAKEKFQDLLGRYPDQPFNQKVELDLASCEYALGNKMEARRIYTEIVASATDQDLKVFSLQLLGLTELDLRNYPAAAAAFRKASELETDPVEKRQTRYKLALSLQRGGQFQEARRIYEELLDGAPGPELKSSIQSRLLCPDYFTIQIGVYGQRDNAQRQKEKLAASKLPVFVDFVESKKSHYVRLGRFKSRDMALRARERLLAEKVVGEDTTVVP